MIELIKRVYKDRYFENKDKDGNTFKKCVEMYFIRTKANTLIAIRPIKYVDKNRLNDLVDSYEEIESSK